jgi:hypothetical protein
VLENLYICKPLSVLYSKTNKKVSRISEMMKFFFEESRNLKNKNLDLRNEKFKLCFNKVKVKWDKYSPGYATWEDADTLRRDHPSLFLPPREYVSQRLGVCNATF